MLCDAWGQVAYLGIVNVRSVAIGGSPIPHRVVAVIVSTPETQAGIGGPIVVEPRGLNVVGNTLRDASLAGTAHSRVNLRLVEPSCSRANCCVRIPR